MTRLPASRFGFLRLPRFSRRQRAAADRSAKGVPTKDPVRLLLNELERREVASETLSFIASGLAMAGQSPASNSADHAAAAARYEQPASDSNLLQLSFALNQNKFATAKDDSPPETSNAPAPQPIGSRWSTSFDDDDNIATPIAASPLKASQFDAPPAGGGGGSQAPSFAAASPAGGQAVSGPAGRPAASEPMMTPAATSTATRQATTAMTAARGMMHSSFSSPTFTPAANPFTLGAENVWVIDYKNGVTVLPAVTQHAFSEWTVDLRAQAVGKEVDSYSWDWSAADDATSVSGDTTGNLTFTWDTFAGAARTDAITLTTTFTDTTTDVQTFTFMVDANDSPAWAVDPGPRTWPGVQAPDQMLGESVVSVGAGVGLGLASGQVTAGHGLPSYNPDVPALGLQYSSVAADNQPIFLVQYTLPEGEPVPATLTATLTLDGTTGSPVYYDTSLANPGDVLQFSLQGDATALATGRYDYEIDVADPTAVGSDPYAATFADKVDLINSAGSPFGAGWTLSGLERIWSISGGFGVGGALVESPGGTSVFHKGGLTLHMLGASGDFSSFTHNGNGTYTQTLPDGTVIQFDSSGYQTSVTDRNGNTTTYAYDVSNRISTITDSHGLVTTFAYDDPGTGLLLSITDPAGAETDFDYTSGTLTTITDADGAVWNYGYDGSARLTDVTDPNSNVTTINYGAGDRVESVDVADGSTRGLAPLVTRGLAVGHSGTALIPDPAYLAAAANAEWVDGNGSSWLSQFDWAGFGSPVQSFAPNGGVNLTYRDANDLPWLTADPLARRTRIFFDDAANPTKTVMADDTFSHATYNGFSEPLTIYDGNNHETIYTYDDFGNLLTSTDPTSVTTSYGYDSRGNAIRVTTSLPAPVGGAETAVNTTTTGDQATPVVGSNADGYSVVVWIGPDADGWGIFARQFNPDGTPAGAEFQVNTTTTGDQTMPAVAVAADGSFVIAWASPDGWNDGIFARRYDASGTALDTYQFQVSTTTYGPQWEPAIGIAADNSFMIAWDDPYNGQVTAQRFAANGTPDVAGELTLSDRGVSTDWHLDTRLSMAPDGSFVAGWLATDFTTYSYYDLRTFDADGTPTSSEETAHSGFGVETWDISRGVDGSVLATWTAADSWGFGIWAAVRDPEGTWGSDFLIPANYIGNQQFESSAPLASGGWVVAWQDSSLDGDGEGVFARQVTADGTPVGGDEQLNVTTTGDQGAVHVAPIPGGVAAVWVSDGQDGDGLGVFTRHYLFTAESRMDYDDRSRLVRSIDPLGNVTLFGYDNASNQTGVTDPLGHESTATYDEMHRPLSTVDALTGETDFDYDDTGNLYTLTDPVGNVTTYAVRDGLNRVLTETDPNSNDTTYVYDGNGNLLSVTDRDERVRTFDYDLVGNQVDEVWWDGVTDIYEADYTYDLAGQLLTASDDNSSFTYTYDVLGQLETEEQTFGPVTVDFTYGYDDAGNRMSVSDGTAEVDSTYTDADQLYTLGMSVSSVLGPNLTFGYDAANRLASISRQEGASGDTIDTAYSYDAASRLIDISHSSSNAGALNEFSYGYDAVNRLTTYSGPEGDREYGYDDTNQLTSVTDPSGPTTLESWTYDANGNRLTDGATSYGSPDPGNRMTSDGVYSYNYDDNGNTIIKAKSGERWEYTYDLRNRLTEVKELTGLAGTVLYDAQYTYDVFDHRVGILEDADGAGGGTAVQTWSSYDGANTWADYDSGGTLTMRYLNGGGMDERYARVTAGGTVSWYLTDNINSVRQIVHTDGTEVYSASYTAFGTIVSPSGVGGDRFKYTGREWDAGTGQYYYRSRYYNAGVGRFLGDDPSEFFAGDSDLSRYVSNEPTGNNDPSGLDGHGMEKGAIKETERRNITRKAIDDAVAKNNTPPGIVQDIENSAANTPFPWGPNPCQKWAETMEGKLPPRDKHDRVIGGNGLIARKTAWAYTPKLSNFWGIFVDGHFAIEVKFPDGQSFYLDDGFWGGTFLPGDVPPHAK
jgi:RHS repeat-associated protein